MAIGSCNWISAQSYSVVICKASVAKSSGKRQSVFLWFVVRENDHRTSCPTTITGETHGLYAVSQERARQQRKGLRVKLRIQPPALAALPWEYLYDPRAAEYLCLSRSTPVVRYLELPQSIQPLAVTPPLQVLGMIAGPSDLTPLDVALEKQRIERATANLKAQGLLEWTWLEGQTARDLQRYLRRGPWHVFHFIGHGRYDALRAEGQIALADAAGKTHLFGATDLARLLADHH